jgi:hypothetical protein
VLETTCLIRRMTAHDLDGVMQVELESFPLPWSKESYLGELKNSFATPPLFKYLSTGLKNHKTLPFLYYRTLRTIRDAKKT